MKKMAKNVPSKTFPSVFFFRPKRIRLQSEKKINIAVCEANANPFGENCFVHHS